MEIKEKNKGGMKPTRRIINQTELITFLKEKNSKYEGYLACPGPQCKRLYEVVFAAQGIPHSQRKLKEMIGGTAGTSKTGGIGNPDLNRRCLICAYRGYLELYYTKYKIKAGNNVPDDFSGDSEAEQDLLLDEADVKKVGGGGGVGNPPPYYYNPFNNGGNRYSREQYEQDKERRRQEREKEDREREDRERADRQRRDEEFRREEERRRRNPNILSVDEAFLLEQTLKLEILTPGIAYSWYSILHNLQTDFFIRNFTKNNDTPGNVGVNYVVIPIDSAIAYVNSKLGMRRNKLFADSLSKITLMTLFHMHFATFLGSIGNSDKMNMISGVQYNIEYYNKKDKKDEEITKIDRIDVVDFKDVHIASLGIDLKVYFINGMLSTDSLTERIQYEISRMS